MTTDHEARAREIVNWTVSEGTKDFSALISAIAKALEETEEAEREACAKVAENALGYGGVPCKQAAALIRTQKETPDA